MDRSLSTEDPGIEINKACILFKVHRVIENDNKNNVII